MDQLVRDLLLFSVGSVTLAKESVEKLATEVQKKYDLSPEEGKKFINDLVAKTKTSEEEIRKIVRDELEKAKHPKDTTENNS